MAQASSQISAAMECLVASREHIRISHELIEGSRALVESSRATLLQTDRLVSKGQTRVQYDVHFLDHGGRVFDAIVLDRDSDQTAVEEAHRVDVPSIGAGFDVLCGARLVHRHRRT